MTDNQKRPILDENKIKQCHEIIDDLVKLYQDTDPAHGNKSEIDKKDKAHQALNKVGLLSGILTEWAENQIFGSCYRLAKSGKTTISANESNLHDNELMWYGNDIPEDAFSNESHLVCERVAIANILHNTFNKYGRMGWRLSLEQSLYALNEGQVDWLLEPIKTNKKGNAFDLDELKWAAVKHVYKLMGEGWKKTAARQKIAEECNVKFEAVKKWEQDCIKNRDSDKSTLNSLITGSQFIFHSKEFKCNKEAYQFALELRQSCDPSNPEDKNGLWLSYCMISCLKLEEEYPLKDMKSSLTEAGIRSK